MTHIPAPPTHIEFADISEAYPNDVQALQDTDLTIRQGETFGIISRSSAGKSTLLHLFNRLGNADSSEMFTHGKSTICYSTCQLRDLRQRVTMIFQHFSLMATKTIAWNIALPLKMAGVPTGERQRQVNEVLELVGLSAPRDSYPTHLSDGQKQRTGITRVLVTRPEILLCNEATSTLDPKNTLSMLTLLEEINQRLGLTIMLITREIKVIRTLCDRVSVLEGGRIVEQSDIWRTFGNPQHPVTYAILGPQHPDHPETGPPLHDGEQIATLRFDSSSGRESNLQHIVSLLRGDARLLYSNCGRIQGRVIGQLQVRLSGPLAANTLVQDGWVTGNILTHHHQTAETTASQPSSGIILPILCQG